MTERRLVSLIHPDPERLRRLGDALHAEFELVLASSAASAFGLLSRRSVDLVVIEGREGLAHLDELERRTSNTRKVLLFDGSALEPLIRAMDEGHLFIALPEPENPATLARHLRTLLYPRLAERQVPLAPLTVRLSGLSLSGAYPVLDVSRGGMGFRTTDARSAELFRPGTLLEGLSLWRGEQQVMSGVSAVVRHVAPFGNEDDTPGAYKVGVAFQKASEEEAWGYEDA